MDGIVYFLGIIVGILLLESIGSFIRKGFFFLKWRLFKRKDFKQKDFAHFKKMIEGQDYFNRIIGLIALSIIIGILLKL
jgi:hypothetical protein